MRAIASVLLASVLTCLGASAQTLGPDELPEIIVVTGRQPGPPLWRVQKDDYVLWILPVPDVVPRNMQWATARIETVLSMAEAYLPLPNVSFELPASIVANPVNWVRGIRLQKRLARNSNGARLPQVLTPELARRYEAVRRRHLPRDHSLDRLRPSEAGWRIQTLVFENVGLEPPQKVVLEPLARLVKKNRRLQHLDTEIHYKLEGSFGSLASRADALLQSVPREQELACFQWHMDEVETQLEPMARRANAWARGNIALLRQLPQPRTGNPCTDLLTASSERGLLADSEERRRRHWIALAENALATYKSSFAVLNMNEVLRSDGLLAQLKIKGYAVLEPMDR